MLSVDMKTSVFIYILVNYICTYVLALTWHQSRERFEGIGFILADFVFLSAGMTLASFRETLHPLFTVILANFLMFTGTILFLFGMAQFLRVTVHRKPYYIYSAVFTALYSYHTFLQPDVRMRILLFSGLLIPVFMHIVYLAFFSSGPEHRRYVSNTGGIFILFTFLYLFRFYYAFTGDPVASYFSTPIPDVFMVIFSLLLTILLVYSLQLMINSRLFHQVKKDAMEQEKLLKKTEILATMDSLTCIGNRRKMEALLANETERFQRYGQSFSVVLCDIDHFKRINDSYGHDIGDQSLVMVTDILSKNIRSTDHLGRWGGEEFLILFPGLELWDAFQAAEKLRQLIFGHSPDFIVDDKRITLSFGVAEFSHESDIETVIRQADQALYLAKERGRNRVEVYENYASGGSSGLSIELDGKACAGQGNL